MHQRWKTFLWSNLSDWEWFTFLQPTASWKGGVETSPGKFLFFNFSLPLYLFHHNSTWSTISLIQPPSCRPIWKTTLKWEVLWICASGSSLKNWILVKCCHTVILKEQQKKKYTMLVLIWKFIWINMVTQKNNKLSLSWVTYHSNFKIISDQWGEKLLIWWA